MHKDDTLLPERALPAAPVNLEFHM